MSKKTYVYMERIGTGPNLDGYDHFLAEWSDWHGVLVAVLEETDIGQPYTVRLTVLEMNDDEYSDFCRENEIDVTGDLAS